MASPLQLSAASSIINGKGLAVSSAFLANVTAFQNLTSVKFIANIFGNARQVSAINSYTLANALGNIGRGVTNGHWLIDFYPANVSAVSSGVVYDYFTGNSNTASFSNTLLSQANVTFTNMPTFANIYTTVYNSANSNFDTISSFNLLRNRTYNQLGLGFSGPGDVATNGLATSAGLIANVISTWGTMYDIKNISGIGNPYIFGQNLLNQNLGQYGGLSNQLSFVGLNIKNLLQIPQSSATTSQQANTTVKQTTFGAISLPTITTITTSTIVSGTSPAVVTGIYSTISGTDLKNIITATNTTIANTSITTLNDYLNFNKVIPGSIYIQLSALGIVDFASFGSYLQYRVGTGNFTSWNDLSTFLNSIAVPSSSYTSTTSSSPVLSTNTISTLGSTFSNGSGVFNNTIMFDYLGAAAGVPYTKLINTLVNNYSIIANSTGLLGNLSVLNTAVSQYVFSSGSITNVTSAVANVNISLANLLTSNVFVSNSQSSYYTMLAHLGNEVSNLANAQVSYTGTTSQLINFAQRIGTAALDTQQIQTYQFLSNLITSDVFGDTISSAFAETINTKILTTKGIKLSNDPSPSGMISQSIAQNIPLTTYITQNM